MFRHNSCSRSKVSAERLSCHTIRGDEPWGWWGKLFFSVLYTMWLDFKELGVVHMRASTSTTCCFAPRQTVVVFCGVGGSSAPRNFTAVVIGSTCTCFNCCCLKSIYCCTSGLLWWNTPLWNTPFEYLNMCLHQRRWEMSQDVDLIR